jgi:PAS domain S-box-containing protein
LAAPNTGVVVAWFNRGARYSPYLSVTSMERSDRQTRPSLAGTGEDLRQRVASSSLSRTPSFYAVSLLFLAAVVVGFIWHDLRGAYHDTLAYWNARLSGSADDRVRFDTLWLDERRRDTAAVTEDPYTVHLLSVAGYSTTSQTLEARQYVEQQLAGIQRAKGYLQAVVVDRGCHVVARSSAHREGAENYKSACFWVYRTGKFDITASGLEQGHILLHLAAPVFADEATRPPSQAPRRVSGAVILVAEPWKEILPFVAVESDPARTSRTLIVWEQDGATVIFSPGHKTRGETPVFRRPLGGMTLEALAAHKSELPFGEYTDCRGVRVFAVAKLIPVAGCSVVRKVDRDEALSEYHRRAVLEALVGALSILLFGFVMLTQHRKAARRGLRDKVRQHRALLRLKQHVEVSEERFSKAFQASPTVLTITSWKDDRFIEVNNAFEQVSGWHRDEVIGRTIEELGLWSDPQALERVRHRLSTERRLRNVESLFRTKTGEQRIGLLSAEIIEFAGELCTLAVLEDVTERKRAEEELRQSKEELQSVTASIPDYLWSGEVDSGGNWKYRHYSSVVEKITGRPAEFYLQGPDAWLSTVHPEDQPRAQQAYERLRRGQVTRDDREYRIVLPNGIVRWVLDSAKVRQQNGGIRIDGVVSDITERKQAEEALMRQAAFDELMAQILVGFATCPYCDVDTSVTAALQATAEFIGVDRAFVIMFSPDQGTWSTTHEWYGPSTSPRLQHYQNIPFGTFPWSEGRILADEVIRVNNWDDLPPEALAERPNVAEEAPLSVLKVPIKTAAGEVRGCVGLQSKTRPLVWSDTDVARVKMVGDAIANVIERKRAEVALRQSEQRYRDFISHSNEGVWRVELEQPVPLDLPEEDGLQRILQYGYVAECNMAHVRNLGLSAPEELLGKRLGELIPHGDLGQETIESFRSAVRDGFLGRTVEFRAHDKAGNPKYLFRTETPIVENGRLVRVWGMTRDVTELKLAEEQLRKSEERWRAVFENSAAGIALSDPASTRFLSANAAFQKMLGYSEEELRAWSFLDITHETDREANRRLLAELLEGRRPSYEMQKRYRRKDGNLIWVSIQVSLVPGTESIPRFCMAIAEDVSERKRAQEELQHSFEQLRALTARLQGIREEERKSVAREIHDELGQALTAIKIDLASLMRELPADQERQRRRTDSILELVDQTIQSVRRISTELRPGILDDLGLVAALEWAAEEFEARTGTRCRLDLPGDDIEIDQERATAMFRIFQETLTNVARHAKASEVGVRLAKDNGDLTLEVHDNGKGIDEEELSAGGSLGILGMRERATLLGGELGILGAPQNGTTVRVRIPITHLRMTE